MLVEETYVLTLRSVLFPSAGKLQMIATTLPHLDGDYMIIMTEQIMLHRSPHLLVVDIFV
jgi:hypothetical protein